MLRAGQSSRDVDDACGAASIRGPGVAVSGEHAGGAQQVVGDRRAQHPGGVRAEPPRRDVRQRSVDQVGEHGFDDRVLAVGDVSARRRRSVLVKNG